MNEHYQNQSPQPKLIPNTEYANHGTSQIPFVALQRLGKIFKEGEIKYGKNNWQADPSHEAFWEERNERTIKHLYAYLEGDTTEDHLAKVAWWAVVSMWRQHKIQQDNLDGIAHDMLVKFAMDLGKKVAEANKAATPTKKRNRKR